MKNFIKLLTFAALIIIVASCRKQEVLDVDFNKYNLDFPEGNSDLDKWLNSSFLDPYNMRVIYKFNRYYYGDPSADITPPKAENVLPMMQIVSDGYLTPYKNVAGLNFVQKTNPKEWVLYGSNKYQTDGSAIAGTASGGTRITLYGLNYYSTAPSFATSRLYVIHHEFTHILNQTVAIPIDFEAISGGSYKQPWTATLASTAKDNGFLGSYASGSPTEDYAETTATLLVSGQSYYDNYANTANATAKSRLKLKESNVVNYFNTAFGINFRQLQREVQNYIKNTLKDPAVSFGYWLNRNLYKTMSINLENDVTYSQYGISDPFKTAYLSSKTNVGSIFSNASKLTMTSLKLTFTSATAMTLTVNFSQGTTNYVAVYNYTMSISDATGATKFTLVTTPAYTGNALLLQSAMQPIFTYLDTNNFTADWLPAGYVAGPYSNFGGFYVTGSPTNYFYGALTQ
jgi:substrate import-associated zinc metallohydrolase lipoprotein